MPLKILKKILNLQAKVNQSTKYSRKTTQNLISFNTQSQFRQHFRKRLI